MQANLYLVTYYHGNYNASIKLLIFIWLNLLLEVFGRVVSCVAVVEARSHSLESFLLPTKKLEEIQDVNLRKFDLHPPQPEKVSESLGGERYLRVFSFSPVMWSGWETRKSRSLVGFITWQKRFGLLLVLLEPGWHCMHNVNFRHSKW